MSMIEAALALVDSRGGGGTAVTMDPEQASPESTSPEAGTGDSGGYSDDDSTRARFVDLVRSFSCLSILAMIISIVIIHCDMKNYEYYWAALFYIALFLIQFCFTVRIHNQRAYRRPPQFNKRGGDDHA